MALMKWIWQSSLDTEQQVWSTTPFFELNKLRLQCLEQMRIERQLGNPFDYIYHKMHRPSSNKTCSESIRLVYSIFEEREGFPPCYPDGVMVDDHHSRQKRQETTSCNSALDT